ncbi:hypothetical protein [Nonomuraea sp. NPDC049709]|uniref:hypothetical protein n=1 Tax=Nonomuraea sp. NPDC049709 TaxID=3154736 RepID=UPI0034301E1C
MADLEFPADVLAAWRAYATATAEVVRRAELLPRECDIASGKAPLSDEPYAALAQAQARRHEALAELERLPWWETVENRVKAELALRRAARRRGDVPPGAWRRCVGGQGRRPGRDGLPPNAGQGTSRVVHQTRRLGCLDGHRQVDVGQVHVVPGGEPGEHAAAGGRVEGFQSVDHGLCDVDLGK